ncbi:Ultraviolet N-glycosylase/AP lyase [Pseudodesulfovibrio hydrargyri]|uniref:Endonuclease III n=1 Tax=Pseudodesulfovibrio hydrargyri TaxID=2125990 RepID=A0A1J5MZ00_9BACT|nr:endonuclease III [Pseudodesulfovibrio hydrargyri]OIQ51678.1 Ultraviolet N-glycosylase/AP lyase [Pseudodesulfovibrio hydrargyri]
MNKKERAAEIFDRLSQRYPTPKPALDYTTAWELLVATALSAQCTDERVNKVTPVFFERWPTIEDAAGADVAEIEDVVRSTGFFRNKAKNIKAAAQRIMSEYNGEVPRTMAELITLGGVARKTASIVLANAFGVNEGIAVDTHVKRLAFRMGLTTKTDPIPIEKDLMPLFPRKTWGDVNHLLVFFGREVCPARKPKCDICELNDICPKKGVA